MKGNSYKLIVDLAYKKPELKNICLGVYNTIESFVSCYNNGNKILVCGNGGSSTDSQHIVGELMKNFKIKRELPLSLKEKIKLYFNDISNYVFDNVQFGLFTMSLVGEIALITALCNDSKPDLVYASQVLSAGKEGDVLLVISTSGNSKNIIYACKMAKVKGIKIIGLTGDDGGELNDNCDILIKVPSNETYLIQEYHMTIYHTICAAVENEIFGE